MNKNQNNYQDVWDFTENPSEIQFDGKKAYADFLTKIDSTESTNVVVPITSSKSRIFNLRNLVSAIAAIFIGVVSFFVLSKNDLVNINSNDITTEYILPDNSKVILYPNSTLTYDKSTFTSAREVKLSGKALFDVTKSGSKFSISQGNVNVVVLGTTFIVSPDEVKVLEGAVQVSTPNGQKTVNTREKIKLNSNELTIEPATFINEVLSTKSMSYDNEPIGKVLSDLEGKFDVSISNPKKINISTCSITATNLSNSSFEECLRVLKSVAGLELSSIDNKVYSISSIRCN
jgi:transmembrane sensor